MMTTLGTHSTATPGGLKEESRPGAAALVADSRYRIWSRIDILSIFNYVSPGTIIPMSESSNSSIAGAWPAI
jgi:hypothetical protein